MDFEYTANFYLDENDINEMCELVENNICETVEEAIDEVARGWEDYAYYSFDYVRDDVISYIYAELERREKGR